MKTEIINGLLHAAYIAGVASLATSAAYITYRIQKKNIDQLEALSKK